MKAAVITLLFGVLCTTEGIKSDLRNSLNYKDSTRYKDCNHVRQSGYKKSGVYHFWHKDNYPFQLYCEHDFKLNASFTIIQRRMYGNVNFYRYWHDYVYGFGDVNGDYWAGLNNINYLTTYQRHNILQIFMTDWLGNTRNVLYQHFKVDDAKQSYRMSIGGFSGQVPDDLSYNNGMNFSTPDRPDRHGCALNQTCGWWFNYCSLALPNGVYYHGGHYIPPPHTFYNGIYWKDWLGYGYSLKYFAMQLSTV